MPEKWDFSKIENQNKFDTLTEKERNEIVGKAQGEVFGIQDKVKSEEAKNYDEADKIIENENIEQKIVEFEKELSPEDIEKIMEKVQDIDEIGIAYSVMTRYSVKNLNGYFKNGLLASSPGFGQDEMDPISISDLKEWKNKIRNEKKYSFYFNIVGRELDIRKSNSRLPRINYSKYFDYLSEYSDPGKRIVLLFDISAFKEDYPYERELNRKFKSKTYRLHDTAHLPDPKKDEEGNIYYSDYDPLSKKETKLDIKQFKADSEFGFMGNFRVVPRYFKGIVIQPTIKYQDLKNSCPTDKFKQLERRQKLGEISRYEGLEDVISIEMLKNNIKLDREIEESKNIIVLSMTDQYKNKRQLLLPIYDYLGNLIWPKKLSHEEVKKFVAERDKNKKEDGK